MNCIQNDKKVHEYDAAEAVKSKNARNSKCEKGEDKPMKVKLMPEERDEKRIAEIQNARKTMNDAEYAQYLRELVRSDEKNFDAIFYAAPNGGALLSELEDYLHDHLVYDERDYYAAQMSGQAD